ncbi:MAG: hypothetical protein NTX01_07915 [Candidatus Omnitrophica bacterium]|nr:hypothetical protein [Candidatus Omnitrophota bacterium]
MLNNDAKILIEKIKDSDYNLNTWEMDFMISIEEQVDRGKNLSKGQGDKLQDVYRKTQGGGIYIGRDKVKRS